jgi:hypothetical protein
MRFPPQLKPGIPTQDPGDTHARSGMGQSSFTQAMDMRGALSCLPSGSLQRACGDAVAKEDDALHVQR